MSGSHLLPAPSSATAVRYSRFGYGFGDRLLLLILLGLGWVVPAFWNKTFLWGMLIWDVALLLVAILDASLLPRPEKISVERSWVGVPAIGCASEIRLQFANTSSQAIRLDIQDNLPTAFAATTQDLKLIVPTGKQASVSYIATALERGDFEISGVYFHARSILGFAERWYYAPLKQQVRIYPNLEAAKKSTIYLTRSRQIEQEKRRLRLRGMGREFESLREYNEGDDFRDVSWSATARRGKPITRLYTVERSQPVWIVLDTGRLLRERSSGLSKLDYAADAAVALSQLALYSGDRVGLLAYGRQVKHRVPLGRGLPHLRSIVEELAVIKSEAAEADHLRAAGMLLSMQKRRGLIVWLTDLAETSMTPEVIEGASQMLNRNVVLFVAIGEADLARTAAARPANEKQMYELVAAQEMLQRRELLISRLRNRGALALEVMPHQLSTTLMNHYLTIKERSLL